MDERLKGLKKAMKNNTFQHVHFQDAHRKNINERIEHLCQDDITPVILPLLTQKKTGSNITQLLHARGIKSIVNNEGVVYTILHTQEQLGTVESSWSENGEKYYKLTNKGLTMLQKEELQRKDRFSLKHLFQEVITNEN